jgi:hypothetical protein
MEYKIEATGSKDWTAYRYQFHLTHSNQDLFGYASTEEEARETIQKAQAEDTLKWLAGVNA